MPAEREHPAAAFRTTQWTRVLEARGTSPEAREALSDLAETYYAPVFAFIRRSTDDETARDLTQEFFTRLLGRNGINNVDPERGRFRSFMLGAVKHFLADVHNRDVRLKRGGGHRPVSLETRSETSAGGPFADATAISPEREFDRRWALTVLDRALAALAHEHKAAGKGELFDTLKPWLNGDTESLSQAEAARQLNMNEGAVKVAIHRVRRRFRDLVKTEIARTLRDPAQVNDELGCLIAALSGC